MGKRDRYKLQENNFFKIDGLSDVEGGVAIPLDIFEMLESFVYDKKWNIGDLILAIIILLIVAGIVLWFVFCLIWTLIRMNVKDMILYSQYEFETSHFYEENYVKPEEAKLTFPKEKRNLILIFMESMESSFAKTKTHDYFNADLISE